MTERIKTANTEPLIGKEARLIMKQIEGASLMIRLAKELRRQGDNSAIVEERPEGWPKHKLILRWDLKPDQSSKGVEIVASSDFGYDVGFTLDATSWRYLRHRWPSVYFLHHPYFLETGQLIENFFQQGERSLEEQVRFAMLLARDNGDDQRQLRGETGPWWRWRSFGSRPDYRTTRIF